MKSRITLILLLSLCGIFSFQRTFAQCTGCIVNKTYTGGNSVGNSWSPSGAPNSTTVARFSGPGPFVWNASANNSVSISGLVLEPNVSLEIGRTNNNEVAAFNIVGGCITVGTNSTLYFSFFTKMENLTICVESGGKLIYNSDATGGSAGMRDDFNFDNVVINLADATSTIEFGDADVNVGSRGLEITGWTGTAVCNGSTPPSSSGSSGNISWTSDTDICEVLNGRILPVEFVSFDAIFDQNLGSSKLQWATGKEWGSSHFEIERAENSVKNWEKVATVESKGFSEEITEYQFIDNDLALVNGSVFYRIKQVDLDGKFSYSNTKGIQIKNSRLDKSVWVSFPNPSLVGTEPQIKLVQSESYNDEPIHFKIMNSIGSGISGIANSPIELDEIASSFLKKNEIGVFIVNLNWGENSQSLKLIRN
ncbi:fibronectin type III domain-containing protein [Algoriphagus pacificus]|uniref:Por secretion system C-terminal sorting domain-containing protein n=1 Tax=Algoriphagus pacificus TaxID=2811234 RepID=A0ABS3CAM5_9BACT|nr:hypothetical protein [Algoriphagus pacificus]MBN7814113.1 hypothetical protein [Algoriphagus pacificus]